VIGWRQPSETSNASAQFHARQEKAATLALSLGRMIASGVLAVLMNEKGRIRSLPRKPKGEVINYNTANALGICVSGRKSST